MPNEQIDLQKLLENENFPLSNKYDPQWVVDNEMGPNALWLTEWLCRDMDLRPGMRVLDMGCGKCLSSVFLAREFGVQVWANDLWISATDNWKRIREAGMDDKIFPIHAEARSLPYAQEFFDAIVCIDSYAYYGTDETYLPYFCKFVKPGGQIGLVVPGLAQEVEGSRPEHLTRRQKSGAPFWGLDSDCWIFRTARWWRRHWERRGLVDIEVAEAMPDGCRAWLQHEKAIDALGKRSFPSDAEALAEDDGRYLGFIRMIARRKETSV